MESPYKINKTQLKRILIDEAAEETLGAIRDVVRRTNDIVRHAYQLIKMIVIANIDLKIDKRLVRFALQACCVKDKKGNKKSSDDDERLKSLVFSFRRQNYDPLLASGQKLPDGSRLTQILNYQATDMVQNIETIASLQYCSHLWKFVKQFFSLRERRRMIDEMDITDVEKDARKKAETRELVAVKTDLTNVTDDAMKSHPRYHSWIRENRPFLRPHKANFAKDSIAYDVKVHPLDYVSSLVYMSKKLEDIGREEDRDVKLFHALPLRSSLIPTYVTIDTECLGRYLFSTKHKGTIVELEDCIWGERLKIEERIFRRGHRKHPRYVFNHMITTDGVGVSISLVRKDLAGKRMVRSPKSKNEDVYIDDEGAIEGLRDRKLVAIDPNKGDLIFCNDGRSRYRYTQNTRRRDLKTKKYRAIMKEMKGDDLRAQEVELSNLNTKTCDSETFTSAVRAKNEYAHRFSEHYSQYMYRKLKLNGFINKQKSEAKMLHDFEASFGDRGKILIAFGDHEQRGKQMRGLEPTVDVGLRKLFKRNGFELRLVDEFRTSCRCHLCEGENETYLRVPNPKPWKCDETKTCHGLLRCKTPSCAAASGMNRDRVATENILEIARRHLSGRDRPKYLRRNNRVRPLIV